MKIYIVMLNFLLAHPVLFDHIIYDVSIYRNMVAKGYTGEFEVLYKDRAKSLVTEDYLTFLVLYKDPASEYIIWEAAKAACIARESDIDTTLLAETIEYEECVLLSIEECYKVVAHIRKEVEDDK